MLYASSTRMLIILSINLSVYENTRKRMPIALESTKKDGNGWGREESETNHLCQQMQQRGDSLFYPSILSSSLSSSRETDRQIDREDVVPAVSSPCARLPWQ